MANELMINAAQRNELQLYLDNTSSPRNITRVLLTILSLLTAPLGILLLQSSETAEIGIYWLLLVLMAVAMWCMGWNRDYGRNAPTVCVREGRYVCMTVHIKSIKENLKGKAPFQVVGTDGNVYECPHYLDYRDARQGDLFLGVLAGSRMFAFAVKPDGESVRRIDITDPALNTMVPEDAP